MRTQAQIRKGSQGFTLLELMMVVIIIGILAAIALPQYTNTAERSRAAEALINLSALRQAEIRYRLQVGNSTAVGVIGDLDVGATNSAIWTYTINSTTADAVATRSGTLAEMHLDITSGNRCSSNVSLYGGIPLPGGNNCS